MFSHLEIPTKYQDLASIIILILVLMLMIDIMLSPIYRSNIGTYHKVLPGSSFPMPYFNVHVAFKWL